jgi:hypothetical protein
MLTVLWMVLLFAGGVAFSIGVFLLLLDAPF